MLDQFDIKLLAALQQDSEVTQSELSQKINLSATQCARRLERLRNEQYIQSVVAILNPAKLGFSVVAHTLVSLRAHTEGGNERLHRFIETAPEILECYSQTGDADFLMKVMTRDLDHLSQFLERMIRVTDNLASVKSSIVLKTIKKTTALPLQIVT
ncbi:MULTISPECIES: Lrp/AsnC family transcriptional regulator [Rhizobium]|uniref:DNA-binding Lrp family transcriptional regulator n=1 Tax=Rhizobium etli TaxID=29449 RepID=A0A7W6ZL16_RHIET|nr:MULTISPECIES: Lrp/AsnC family transcriptional regulator [Rhizobium]MBB4481843.1 DNA-binding Lrp family transcriptional regulator [Rhizobium etli]MBB4537672.1 DNA-binding Lrp family transcriptional regulator [Rhizobium etli]ULR47165.1 Lrp/AsnC family transcriptional regulator [Rhizobium sp. K102]